MTLAAALRSLAGAPSACDATVARLTPIRRHVLALLSRCGKSVGGYDLLRRYEEEYGRSSANTIYRTLRYLVGAGLVVHLPSTKTFVLREASEAEKLASAFLVCIDCGSVNELADGEIVHAVRDAAEVIGFRPTRAVEIEGLCHRCQRGQSGRLAKQRRAIPAERKPRRRGDSRPNLP